MGIATSAIDVSDGLSTDLRHLCEESHLTAVIDGVPLHPLALRAEASGAAPSALDLALHGGEDYELLFTASPRAKVPATIGGVPIHAIGEMRPKRRGQPTVQMMHAGKLVTVEPRGWEHFSPP